MAKINLVNSKIGQFIKGHVLLLVKYLLARISPFQKSIYRYSLDSAKQTVAIVISCFNHSEYTLAAIRSCLDSIDSYYNYVIIIMDDFSTDNTFDLFANPEVEDVIGKINLGNYCYVRYKRNYGLTQTWNDGIALALEKLRARYVFLVNNDVIFSSNALKKMISAMADDGHGARIGVVGPMTNAPGHQPAQHIKQLIPGYVASSRMEVIEAVAAEISSYPCLDADFVNGFFMGFPTESLEKNRFSSLFKSWYFDPRCENIGNEDEFQKRLTAAGLRRVIVQNSFIFHYKDVSQHRAETVGAWMQEMIYRD